MPGHIGTSIPLNSRKIQSGNLSDEINARQIAQARARIASMGRDVTSLSDDDIREMVAERERRFREDAPTSAAEAATNYSRWGQGRQLAHPGRRGRPPNR
jgi:hypothetical protein